MSCSSEEGLMLYYALVFLVVALIAGALGVSGVAAVASQIAWVLFVIAIVLFIVHLVSGRRRPIVGSNGTEVSRLFAPSAARQIRIPLDLTSGGRRPARLPATAAFFTNL